MMRNGPQFATLEIASAWIRTETLTEGTFGDRDVLRSPDEVRTSGRIDQVDGPGGIAGAIPMRSLVLSIFAAIYLLVLIDLTLVRFPQPAPGINLIPMRTIASCWADGQRAIVVNVVGNILLLAPLGMLLPMAWPNRANITCMLISGFLVSLGIELTQYVCGHRMADVDDVLLNTMGALLGYLAMLGLQVVANLVRLHRPSTAGRSIIRPAR